MDSKELHKKDEMATMQEELGLSYNGEHREVPGKFFQRKIQR
jgi:hypothetical protein